MVCPHLRRQGDWLLRCTAVFLPSLKRKTKKKCLNKLRIRIIMTQKIFISYRLYRTIHATSLRPILPEDYCPSKPRQTASSLHCQQCTPLTRPTKSLKGMGRSQRHRKDLEQGSQRHLTEIQIYISRASDSYSSDGLQRMW